MICVVGLVLLDFALCYCPNISDKCITKCQGWNLKRLLTYSSRYTGYKKPLSANLPYRIVKNILLIFI